MLTPLFEALRTKIEAWKLNLPPVVLLVKTSGQEEGVAYCRGPAIVLPRNVLGAQQQRLPSLLPHELFHVLSSHNARLREALYASIGFQACNRVALPGPLASRKITNPDAPVNDHYLTIELDGRPAEVMPVLYSKIDRYNPAQGGTLFAYLEFKLMLLENDAGVRRAALSGGRPTLLDPKSTPGFAEQVGRNTSYTIHPEEILAENFVFLLNGRIDLPSPRVVEQMGNILQLHAAVMAAPSPSDRSVHASAICSWSENSMLTSTADFGTLSSLISSRTP